MKEADRQTDEMRAVLTELVRLKTWRDELGVTEDLIAMSKDTPPMEYAETERQLKRDLRQYGREKAAAWERARAVLATQPVVQEKETIFVWLIENVQLGTYWDGRSTRREHGPHVTYVLDANEAVRFARKEDAERIIGWLLPDEPVVAREHGFMPLLAAPVVSPSSEALLCSQCGQPFDADACGPTHALIAHERITSPTDTNTEKS